MAFSLNAFEAGDGGARENEAASDDATAGQRTLFEQIRPLVRYVDRERAVVETRIRTRRPVVSDQRVDLRVDAVLTITDQSGFEDEIITQVQTHNGRAMARFELVWPKRWWPAGMGEQSLYELTISLQVEGVVLDQQTAWIGLTSVRPTRSAINEAEAGGFLVNSQPYDFKSVVHVDHVHQHGILPAGAEALLVVRDHYAPDVFFDATDRAGILALQCVPLDADAQPEGGVAQEVERLSAHPSLMGYYVGHQGSVAEGLARKIRKVDPTRPVYRALPFDA